MGKVKPTAQDIINYYRTYYGATSNEEAIKMARARGKWGAQQDVEYRLSGGLNMGRVGDELVINNKKEEPVLPPNDKHPGDKLKDFGKGLLLAAGFIAAPEVAVPTTVAAALVGCQNGVMGDDVTTVNANQSVGLNMTVKLPDNKAELAAQTEALEKLCVLVQNKGDINDNNQKNIIQKLDALAVTFKNLMNNSTAITKENLERLYDMVDSWLGLIDENQKSFSVQNHKDIQELKNQIYLVLDGQEADSVKLEKIINLLTDIKDINDTFKKEVIKRLDELKGKANKDYSQYFETLINNVEKGNVSLENIDKQVTEISKYSENLNKLVNIYRTEGINLGNAILAVIQKIDFSQKDVDLTVIEELLKQAVGEQKLTNTQLTQLTKDFKNLSAIVANFSEQTFNQLATIISKMDKKSPDYTAQLCTIIELLANLDAKQEVRNQNTIKAIENVGVVIVGQLTKIYNEIKANKNLDYTTVLNAILAKLGTIEEADQARHITLLSWLNENAEAILNAIKDHQVIVEVKNGCCCCKENPDNPPNEGIIGNLNELLG